ncbi:hypothetical protein KY313_01300 [Candidatus Woesearchaeota archaeon]|jgi:hypothetical protein|nr:hypothetical protein [Candidatus Woesearchaeota archaeon]
MGLETTISKLKDDYQLSFKNVEPYGSLAEKTFNIKLNKKDLMSFYKELKTYIKENYNLEKNS